MTKSTESYNKTRIIKCLIYTDIPVCILAISSEDGAGMGGFGLDLLGDDPDGWLTTRESTSSGLSTAFMVRGILGLDRSK